MMQVSLSRKKFKDHRSALGAQMEGASNTGILPAEHGQSSSKAHTLFGLPYVVTIEIFSYRIAHSEVSFKAMLQK